MTVTLVKVTADDRSGTVKYYVDGKLLAGVGAVIPIASLDDYAQGSIIRGGAVDWEAYAAETSGQILVGDGTDIASVAVSGDATLAADGALTVIAADTTKAGKVELATDAETKTGTDTERAVTPVTLAGVIVLDSTTDGGVVKDGAGVMTLDAIGAYTLTLNDNSSLNQNLQTTDTVQFNEVGIRNSSPDAMLHIENPDLNGAADVILEGSNNGNAYLTFRRGAVGRKNLIRFEDTDDTETLLWSVGQPYNSGLTVKDLHFSTSENTSDSVLVLKHSTGYVGIGESSPLGKLHVDQASTTGAVPALLLDQADLSEEFINFVSTVGSGYPIQTGAVGTYYGKIRVSVNGTFKYIPLYDS